MAVSVNDYLIEQSGIDWPAVLTSWSWLVPARFTLWLVNRFADLFLVLDDGSVHMLDVGDGTLCRVADSRDDFCNKMDEGDNANQWLMIPLVDRMVAAGIALGPGQCYGFKLPPVVGGQYAVENIAAISIADYLGACGCIHEQIQDVPDGGHVILKIVDERTKPGDSGDRDAERQ
jgi:hypothetical protein